MFKQLFRRYPFLVIILCTSVIFGCGRGVKAIGNHKEALEVAEEKQKMNSTSSSSVSSQIILDKDGSGAEATDNQPEEVKPQEVPPREFITVTESFLKDSLFIGDSRTVLLDLYANWDDVDYFASIGMNAWVVRRKELDTIDGKLQTLEQVLTTHTYNKVYLMLGINELGQGNAETFAAQMKQTIDLVLSKQPNAVIYLNAIMHVTDEVDQTGGYVNNDEINKRNIQLKTLANNRQIMWIDLNECFDDPKTGKLGEQYTTDGIHIKANYIQQWEDFLLAHGVKLDKTSE